MEQLLDASFNVWHRLSDDEKLSLASFVEEMTEERLPMKYSTVLSPKKVALNSSSSSKTIQRPMNLSAFQIFLKDEREKYREKHRQMSQKEIHQRLAARWKKMSRRMKENYQYRSNLAKKRREKKRVSPSIDEQ